MDIILSDKAEASEVLAAIMDCGADDAVCCKDKETFQLAKVALVKEKRCDVTIQLLDSDGYAIKQVTSKKRDESANRDSLNSRQIKVIRALEKVLSHCRKEGIQLVGYSDELVALPDHIKQEELSSAGALDVNCHQVYKGAEATITES